MKDNVSRLLLCFAALDLPDHELRRLINEFNSLSWEEISSSVSLLREHAKRRDIYEAAPRAASAKRSSEDFDISVGERVERLLKVEAGLTTAQAADELASLLIQLRLLERKEVPPLSRTSLRAWIVRLVKRVPAKEILRCATVLRNEYVKSPARDWTLKGSEEK